MFRAAFQVIILVLVSAQNDVDGGIVLRYFDVVLHVQMRQADEHVPFQFQILTEMFDVGVSELRQGSLRRDRHVGSSRWRAHVVIDGQPDEQDLDVRYADDFVGEDVVKGSGGVAFVDIGRDPFELRFVQSTA